MAGGAICSKLSVMFIGIAMTGITILRRAFINTVLMTTRASRTDMRARQFECREVVIKSCTFPCGRSVAGSAARTKLSIVFIVTAMA